MCKPYLQFLYGTYFNSNSELFIISQPKVSFQFLILRENSYEVFTRAVVFRLFQKMVILPPKPVGFRLTVLYPIVRPIFSSDLYQFAWIKHQSVHFCSVVQGFCSTKKPISTHNLWKCDWTIVIFINLMLVMISFTHVFKVFSNISASS